MPYGKTRLDVVLLAVVLRGVVWLRVVLGTHMYDVPSVVKLGAVSLGIVLHSVLSGVVTCLVTMSIYASN